MTIVDRARGDLVDVLLEGWGRERPDLDLAPMALVERVTRLSHLLDRRVQNVSRRYGLDAGLFEVLLALRQAGRPYTVSPTDLAKWLLLSPGALTNRLYRLEAEGLIRRIPDPDDRRGLLVALTVEGMQRLEQAVSAYLDSTRLVFDSLGAADRDHLSASLRRLLADHEAGPIRKRGPEPANPDEPADGPRPDIGDRAFVGRASSVPVASPWWPDSRVELERLQRRLARQAREVPPWEPPTGETVAIGGVFVALPKASGGRSAPHLAWAAAVVMEGHDIVATATATRMFPEDYEPGYYALAVGPILEDVVRALCRRPDALIVNRAGRDHVRGAGLAVHLGAALDLPTIGITDRPLVAEGSEPDSEPGSWTPLRGEQGIVGCTVRTVLKAQPVAVHAGWRTDAATARDVVVRCTNGRRTPEPIRRARQLAFWLSPDRDDH